jgi:Zn-dependent protease with chaperone function
MQTLYPKCQKAIDDSFIKPSGDFKIKIIKVILAIGLFVLFYLFLLILAICLLVISFYAAIWIFKLKVGYVSIAIGAGLIALGVMVFLFLIKFLFARYKHTNPYRLQITKKEHPLLFELIKKLSTEVKTKFPKKIFLVPDVNAAVFYNSSFWSMFLPIRKNLEIGLGLVNSLNISEFQSVIAHEFGHFSQKSTRLGSYVYTANKVIYNLVYDYDNWDKMLLSWSQIEGIFGSFASITSWLVEVIRKILSKAYDIINLMYLGLSREMEFQADLVACSVSGKEAMISALRKIEFSFMAYDQTISFLNKFIETNFRSENIFENHRSIIKKLSKDFGLEIIEDLPRITDQDLERNTVKSRVNFKDQWASHPSREEREKNLQKIKFKIELKNDSAWHLFDGKQALQRKVTNIFYDKGYPNKNEAALMTNNDFLDYIDKEDQKYHISKIFSDFYVSHYAANLEVDKVIEEYNRGKYRNIKHSHL